MSYVVSRVLRVPLVVAVVWMVLSVVVPIAMTHYTAFPLRPGLRCVEPVQVVVAGGTVAVINATVISCASLAEMYRRPFLELFADGMFRSLALLLGAAALALTLGTLLGVSAALMRRQALASGGIVAVTSLLTAVPAFFLAYFLQIAVIVLASSVERSRLLPVYGFGYDEHLILPLLSISLPAIAYTAQLTATRMQDVLDSDFVNVANAKGLRTSWILAVHVLPHVRPVLLEALGSGLRVSVASLPIVEFLFNWGGIGELALAAVGVRDVAGFIFTAVALATLFAVLSAIADLSRPRALYRAS
jgi:peptide/nickel transport system permease protein